MPPLVLLGDSIFDNGAYVDHGEAVIDQLQRHLPGGWAADLQADNGATCADVRAQLAALLSSSPISWSASAAATMPCSSRPSLRN